MSKNECPNCGEDFWVSGARGEDICHECGLDKPKKEEDELGSTPR